MNAIKKAVADLWAETLMFAALAAMFIIAFNSAK